MSAKKSDAQRPVLVDRDGAVLTITIRRPSARNAMTREASELIAAALDELDADPTLAVGILTGADGTFCSGMDLKRFAAGELPSIPGRGFGGLTERQPEKPLIAAVEGFAVAGGFELVLACDLAIAGRSAVFGLPEVRRGLVARAGGLWRLARRAPHAVAMEISLTGEQFGAQKALSWGLINTIVDDGAALGAAHELAERIALNAPLAVAASKRVIDESADWSHDEAFTLQAEITDPVFASADAQEGARAFAERRTPRWSGK